MTALRKSNPRVHSLTSLFIGSLPEQIDLAGTRVHLNVKLPHDGRPIGCYQNQQQPGSAMEQHVPKIIKALGIERSHNHNQWCNNIINNALQS